MDWPRLRVWTNGEMIQDLDVETVPELRHRLRSGYLGLESITRPIRFRGLRVRELPSTISWTPLYETSADLAKWQITGGKPTFEALGGVLHSDGDGVFATTETFRDFELQDVRPPRPASQRRRHVRRPGRGPGPPLRDPAHGRGRRALCHRVHSITTLQSHNQVAKVVQTGEPPPRFRRTSHSVGAPRRGVGTDVAIVVHVKGFRTATPVLGS